MNPTGRWQSTSNIHGVLTSTRKPYEAIVSKLRHPKNVMVKVSIIAYSTNLDTDKSTVRAKAATLNGKYWTNTRMSTWNTCMLFSPRFHSQ